MHEKGIQHRTPPQVITSLIEPLIFSFDRLFTHPFNCRSYKFVYISPIHLPSIYSFMPSFIRWFLYALIHSCLHSFVDSFMPSFIHSFTPPFIHPFSHSSSHSYSFIFWFIFSFSHSVSLSFLDSFIRHYTHFFIRSFILCCNSIIHTFIRIICCINRFFLEIFATCLCATAPARL